MSLLELCLLCFVPGDGVEAVFPGGMCVVKLLLLLWNKFSWPVLHFTGAYFGAGGGCGMDLLRFGRSVTFSFAAKGERIRSSPASQVCAGLLAWPTTAAASSDRWLVGRRGGLSSSSVRARAGDAPTCWQLLPSSWGPQVWRKQDFLSSSVRYGAGDDPRFWQLLLSSWGPQQRRKEDLAGLPSAEVAGDDDGDIAGCVRQYSLYRGVSCKKAGMYCMLA